MREWFFLTAFASRSVTLSLNGEKLTLSFSFWLKGRGKRVKTLGYIRLKINIKLPIFIWTDS